RVAADEPEVPGAGIEGRVGLPVRAGHGGLIPMLDLLRVAGARAQENRSHRCRYLSHAFGYITEMINRHDFLVGTGMALAFTALGAGDGDTEKLLGGMGEELLGEYPENATGLGIDRGERASLKSKLTDRSAEGQLAIAKRTQARLKRLQAIDVAKLSE